MRKIFLAVVLLLVNMLFSYSQDIIKLNNEETIECKVIKVGEKIVEYKRADNPEGPIYEIRKDNIQTICYNNNSIDYFHKNGEELITDSLIDIYSAKFGIGPTLGYNASIIYDDSDVMECELASGFNIGVTSYIPLVRRKFGNLFIQTSLLYSREVLKYEIHDYINPYTKRRGKDKKDFFKLPVFLGYEFNVQKNISIGPKIGLAYDHLFAKNYADCNDMNFIDGISIAFLKKYRLDLGHQKNIRRWQRHRGGSYDSGWTNYNINLSYLF